MSLELLVGLLSLGFIVGIHEFGHYIVARFCNVGVTTFSIGMGPVIWSRTDSKGTVWKICAIPIGGYIHPKEEESDVIGLKFKEAGMIKGVLVAFAGPFFNFLTAFMCLMFVFLYAGVPKLQVSDVAPNSIAQISNIQKGDILIEINGENVNEKNISSLLANPTLKIKRNNEIFEIQINKDEKAALGISLAPSFQSISTYKAIGYSVSTIWNGVYMIFTQIWEAVSSLKIMGPIGIIKQSASAHKKGIVAFVLFIASISVAIGATNLLPIPLLDGGRILMFIVSGIIKRPIPNILEKILNYASVCVLIAIFAIGFFVDIKGLIK